MSQFSLSWDAHKKNICNGLSSLQQNGEFVDMTLAADGHFVKVHQVIIALASPYIKELMTSTQCPHPVIFLNKISYETLSAILEYIYTGEVLVSMDNLSELIQAGKELHIKGLEDMKLHKTLPLQEYYDKNLSTKIEMEEEVLDDEICYFEITNPPESSERDIHYVSNVGLKAHSEVKADLEMVSYDEKMHEVETVSQDNENTNIKLTAEKTNVDKIDIEVPDTANMPVMQYTVSNQGSLQMILNRFMYYLKHTNRNNTRQWRCVDYLTPSRCPAHVVTRDDMVVQRISSHTHPFHDKRILKKLRVGAIFTAIHEAELEGNSKRNQINTDYRRT